MARQRRYVVTQRRYAARPGRAVLRCCEHQLQRSDAEAPCDREALGDPVLTWAQPPPQSAAPQWAQSTAQPAAQPAEASAAQPAEASAAKPVESPTNMHSTASQTRPRPQPKLNQPPRLLPRQSLPRQALSRQALRPLPLKPLEEVMFPMTRLAEKVVVNLPVQPVRVVAKLELPPAK